MSVVALGFSACSDPDPYPLRVDIAPHLDGELELQGVPQEVSFSPDGRIWLASALGQIAVADSVVGPWRHVGYPLLRDYWGAVMSGEIPPALSRVASFTPDTAIVVGMGFVAGEYSIDAVYSTLRTVDGGESWDSISYGTREWIESAHTSSNGVAWIGGGSEGLLMRSTDYGATWETIGSPFASRISSIFAATQTEVIVGGLWNDLSITRDGGATWLLLETPFDQSLIQDSTSDHAHRLTRVAVWGDQLLVGQGGHVFSRRRDEAAWRELPDRPQLFVVDAVKRRLFTVTAAGDVTSYDAEMRGTRFGRTSLIVPAQDIAALGDRAVILDTEGALHEVKPSGTTYSFPLTEGRTRPLLEARLHGDEVWAVTDHQIYFSSNSGQTWERVGFVPTAIRSFLVRTDGTLLLWDGHGRNLVFQPSDHSLRPLEGLEGYDVVDILSLVDRWIAFGGRQYETTGRVEVSRTFYAGQFNGSRENGFVLESRDEGETWRVIDEWREGGVANLFVSPRTGTITMVSYLGGVRRLQPVDGEYVAENLILPSAATWESVPYVEVPSVVYFYDERHGFIDGWIHQLGERRYETFDGGRRWLLADPVQHHVDAVPSRFGLVVLTGSELDGGVELELLAGSQTTSLFAPERPVRPPDAYPWGGITDVSVNGDRVLVVVDGTEIVTLELPGTPSAQADRLPIR